MKTFFRITAQLFTLVSLVIVGFAQQPTPASPQDIQRRIQQLKKEKRSLKAFVMIRALFDEALKNSEAFSTIQKSLSNETYLTTYMKGENMSSAVEAETIDDSNIDNELFVEALVEGFSRFNLDDLLDNSAVAWIAMDYSKDFNKAVGLKKDERLYLFVQFK